MAKLPNFYFPVRMSKFNHLGLALAVTNGWKDSSISVGTVANTGLTRKPLRYFNYLSLENISS